MARSMSARATAIQGLNRICSRGERGIDPLATPLQIGIESDLYAVASDRRSLLAIAGDFGFAFAPETYLPSLVANASIVVMAPTAVVTVDARQLCGWAEPPSWKNTGGLWTNDLNAEARYGRLFGRAINRELVARVLDPFAQQTIGVRVGGATDPVRFDGDGWRAIVMPIHWPNETECGPEFTAALEKF